MVLKNLRLIHFRNYSKIEEKDFSILNVLYGDNGSGKTNLLESIFLLSAVKPFRKCSLNNLILWNEDFFFIKGEFDLGMIELGFSPEKKSLKLNHDPVKSNELRVQFPILALLPEDLKIVTGNPDDKRTFLDYSLSLLDSGYTELWKRYHRALKQRNAQLKNRAKDAPFWNRELIKWGSLLIRKRSEMVKILNSEVSDVYMKLYGSEMSIRYLNNFKTKIDNTEETFAKALEKAFPNDMKRKFTTIGPHRDKYSVIYRGHEGKVSASHGQTRCMALGMKLALANNIRQKTGNAPILLIDDVLLELDPERKRKMLDLIYPHFQCFITINDPNLLSDLPEHKKFLIRNGSIIENNKVK